jgi:hypothetical protein
MFQQGKICPWSFCKKLGIDSLSGTSQREKSVVDSGKNDGLK